MPTDRANRSGFYTPAPVKGEGGYDDRERAGQAPKGPIENGVRGAGFGGRDQPVANSVPNTQAVVPAHACRVEAGDNHMPALLNRESRLGFFACVSRSAPMRCVNSAARRFRRLTSRRSTRSVTAAL